MEFTFGIITSPGTSEFLEKIITQIKSEVPKEKREIIVVGGPNPNIEEVTHIDFDESQKPMWITRKKNLITQHSTKENIVFLHDYVGFIPGWYQGQLKRGNDFSIRMDKILNFDGTRFRDWSIWPHNGDGMDAIIGRECLVPYHIDQLTPFMYISGTYWIAKREVMLEHPLNEHLGWGQGEDVEWSKIVRAHFQFQMNEYSSVCILKPGKDRAFEEMQISTLKRALSYAGKDIKNRFKIIVPSFNNENWVEYNVASILNQTYQHYDVLYINDASTDNTLTKVSQAVDGLSNWTIISNEENKGATHNYVEFVEQFTENDDIIIHLDGDDWFYDNTVLEQLNDLYNRNDYWMTYGGFVCWDGESDTPTLPHPQSTPHPEFIHKHKKYRQDAWRASHLRTFRSFLFKAIDKQDLRSRIDGQYFWHAADLAWQFPCLEMCPESKIGVVDFFTCVYNQSKPNSIRTQERESSDNTKFELEIRNKKHYKEGLSGEKLPLVNVIGNFRENNSIPTTFSYVYSLTEGEFDITLIEDMELLRFINGDFKIKSGLIVADIHEAPHLLAQNSVYTAVRDNSNMFDLILTYDKELLKLPNAVLRNGGYEVVLNKSVHRAEYPVLQDDALVRIYEDKPKLVSFITSNKTMTDGHRFRLGCAQRIVNSNIQSVDIFGVGIREIKGKIEGLRDYKFSIAVENGVHDNYFTEKILDCFLTGTIPIYKGCNNIGDFFNTKGFITFDTQDELLDILDNLTEKDYEARLAFVKENFETAKQYAYDNDKLFKKYLKHLITNK